MLLRPNLRELREGLSPFDFVYIVDYLPFAWCMIRDGFTIHVMCAD